MSTNNNSQTLFRFASMRNAELSDPKNKERRFIFRKDTQKGVFDPKINSSTSLKKLCEDPSTLPLTIETEESLKAIDAMFYDLAVWIARNKSTATKAEFDAKINVFKSAKTSPYLANMATIWDNLIYQVVTQKDFYAKETLMQFLHLNHILSVYDSTQGAYDDVIKAKVVLPKELFKPLSGPSSSGSNTANKAASVVYNDKNMKMADALIDLQANEKLLASLQSLEKAYQRDYQAAYKEALDLYQKDVNPIQKAYQQEVADVENRKAIMQNRINYLTDLSVGNPDFFRNNPELSEELYTLKAEILNLKVTAPEISEFDFQFRPEIDAAALEETLSEEERSTVCKIFEKNSAVEAFSSVSAYEEVFQKIDQNSQLLQQQVLNNTTLNPQVSTTVGGVVVPVSTGQSSGTSLGFSAKTSKNFIFSSKHHVVITTDNLEKHILSGSYTATFGNNVSSSTEVQVVNQGINTLFKESNDLTSIALDSAEVLTLQGEVTLSDGLLYTMEATLYPTGANLVKFLGTGLFRLKTVTEPIGEPTPTGGSTTSQTDEPFIPSGFGMKNIGITDYKKVEQSTYCYVEGDVAHIENIMAREYKERATRRLKRNESQTTKSSESEKEKLTDTTSTERHEMQSEISKILQESKDFAAQAGFSASWGPEQARFVANANANYATHNSKEESNRQAVTEAKDITARALDRIVTKVKEERIDKILEEYEENNKHGFDNTKGSNHVVGVYRWVDKVVKNQIYNYGKRMMFEFMIPEPAKLHNLGMKISKNAENMLIKPVDPRESSIHKLENFTSLEDDTKLKFWVSKYNVDVDKKPENIVYIGKAFSNTVGDTVRDAEWDEAIAGGAEIQIPEGYSAVAAHALMRTGGEGTWSTRVVIAGKDMNPNGSETSISAHGKAVPVSFSVLGSHAVDVNANVKCQLTQETKNAWLQKTFNKIIEAYEVELAKYEQALAEAKAMGVQIKGSNPGFYRKIENTILRRNCISYMLNQNPSVDLTFGKKRYYTNDGAAEENFANTDIKVDAKLDQYAAFVKFMEQAFEWEIMSYYFYPYYWGERKAWGDLYQFDDNDPVFRAFMQSGMARVIVTVRPGFEEAVRHFLATGQIWNGGEVPVIDDPLFLSIVDELRAPKATKEGEPWREKIPTSLTILQADSIGLKVEKALPCNCEPGVKFDDNLGELCGSNFELNQNQIGQSADKWVQITFNEMDRLQDFKTIKDFDLQGMFPRKYVCMGNEISIDRDANWKGEDSTTKVYKVLADEISQIEGIEAYPTGENGITFKILATKIKNFSFRKPGGTEEWDDLNFSIDFTNECLVIKYPVYNDYSVQKILDKNGQQLTKDDFIDKAPLSKFLV